MLVMKFGGTSVRNARMISKVLSLAALKLDKGVMLISSATGQTTDDLVALGEATTGGDETRAATLLSAISDRHRVMLGDVSGPRSNAGASTSTSTSTSTTDGSTSSDGERTPDGYAERLETLLGELQTLTRGLLVIRDLSPRSSDMLLSFGERLSTCVIAAAARARSIPHTLLDSRTLVRTDSAFGAADVDTAETYRRIDAALQERTNHLYIAQGFIGSNDTGTTTTLGRGGSDFSATLFGSAVGATEVEIWTDVDGIMTADPRLIPEARTIKELSYTEAAELAYFGARVIHPATIVPAVEHAIPVAVRNTERPDGPSTKILAEPTSRGLRAVAGRTGVTIITVSSSRMLNATGFLGRMFDVFARHKTSVDIIATSEVSVSVSVDSISLPAALVQDLAWLGKVHCSTERSIISLVGERFWGQPEPIASVFAAIASNPDARIEMISLGSSDTNLTVVVPDRAYEATLSALHGRFFGRTQAAGIEAAD